MPDPREHDIYLDHETLSHFLTFMANALVRRLGGAVVLTQQELADAADGESQWVQDDDGYHITTGPRCPPPEK